MATDPLMLYVPFVPSRGPQPFHVDFEGPPEPRGGHTVRIGGHAVENVVVNKAGLRRRRGFAAVDRRMARDVEDPHPGTVERESGDTCTFRATHGASAQGSTAARSADSTLHFASAARVSAGGGRFPERGFHPGRVLKPLLALLAMKGVVDPGLLGREESC
ncbi:hypothetical protein [Sinosporangium siamense]|uniref:Uncharacterized protein n=1 Tax=Sinosporangium siamense TaxID=1367973 RepID=A0A919RAL7_9ACTN|nr:hypothetical protein [Sinosporangium siamense]GII90441.1 hypothetical protein Ssi02_06720 [Sinosporangium siamense]